MTLVKLGVILTVSLGTLGLQTVSAQETPPPKDITAPTPSPRLSTSLAKNLEQQTTPVSRERREEAYTKMLEGQRYYWNSSRQRSQSGAKLSKQAFQRAVELDPYLSEGYTALAEIALTTPPNDIDEAILLSDLAVKIAPDNFGAHRILARVYTIKSRLRTNSFDPGQALKAVSEWKEVARLDPRNAEAWAFLSEFYDKANNPKSRIEALEKWLAAANPVETRYYRTIMGAQEDLSPEAASLKLGAALIKANRSGEAVEILSRTIADDAENTEAIDLLKLAVDSATGETSAGVLQAMQQAVFANPNNLVLIELLAQIQLRAGKVDDAAKSLKSSIARLMSSDKSSAANLQVSLGDIYAQANRNDEAITAYEAALKIEGIDKELLNTEDEREFATRVFSKMIQTYKNAGLVEKAKATIERARGVLGNNDLFAERQMISLLRETGKPQEALQHTRALRRQMKEDYSLLRLEAALLTEIGKVDEGVAIVKALIGGGRTSSAPSLMYDDFGNYIYISSLYNQAKRGREAADFAQQAYRVAGSEEKKQIAHLSLASAQQTAGDYKGAEDILRNLLRQTPSNPIALNNLGYFLLQRNEKVSEALSLIQQAVQIDPTNPSYLDSLGWAYFKIGNLSEAEFYLKQAIRNDSNSAAGYEHLGDVYQKQGKSELARTAWQKAMNFSLDADASLRIKNKLSLKSDQ